MTQVRASILRGSAATEDGSEPLKRAEILYNGALSIPERLGATTKRSSGTLLDPCVCFQRTVKYRYRCLIFPNIYLHSLRRPLAEAVVLDERDLGADDHPHRLVDAGGGFQDP